MTFKLGPNQEKWLAALESGEYRQCVGRLHDESYGGYCCLGVANEVFGFGCHSMHTSLLLADCYEALGLRNEVGEFGEDDDRMQMQCEVGGYLSLDLTDANDSGATFAEIAAFIRANPEVVFKEAK